MRIPPGLIITFGGEWGVLLEAVTATTIQSRMESLKFILQKKRTLKVSRFFLQLYIKHVIYIALPYHTYRSRLLRHSALQ